MKAQPLDDELFSPPSKVILKRTADRLLKRLFTENSVQLDQYEKENVSQQEVCCFKEAEIERVKEAKGDHLLAEFLQDIKELQAVPLRKEPSASSDLNIEFKSFEVTFKRTENLEKLYNALLSVKPTTVESERAFSAAGLYLTKMRSSLSENSLNSLCFLKSVFQN